MPSVLGHRNVIGACQMSDNTTTADEAERDHEPQIEKVTVRLTGDTMQRVRALATKHGLSINEFMRRAVSTEAFVLEQLGSGARIFVEDKDSRVKEVVFP
jgi:hypothetical protein